jgi:hypothetical protein
MNIIFAQTSFCYLIFYRIILLCSITIHQLKASNCMAPVSLPPYKLTSHHVVITDCTELEGTAFGLALVA